MLETALLMIGFSVTLILATELYFQTLKQRTKAYIKRMRK